jgi:Cdc6-like AAA superfamily ATPase
MIADIEAEQGRIIWDGAVLSGEADAGKPLGRQKQVAELRGCLLPMLRGERPTNAWLHGPPGSGKTMAARWVVEEVCGSAATRIGVYVNCWQHRTLYSVTQAITDELKILRAEAQDTHVKLDRIRQVLRGRHAVVLLDEIDRPMPAQREEILCGLLSVPNTGLVCIANGTRALATMEERVRSRLCPTVIEFPAYSRQQVAKILADRARRALAPGSWSVSLISAIAGAADGDARAAIQTLGQAAAAAEEAGRETLDGRLVDRLLGQWRGIRNEARLAGLSEHEKIIRALAAKHGPVSTTRLKELHLRHCRRHGLRPMARRTFSKSLARLSTAGLLQVPARPAGIGGRLVRATGDFAHRRPRDTPALVHCRQRSTGPICGWQCRVTFLPLYLASPLPERPRSASRDPSEPGAVCPPSGSRVRATRWRRAARMLGPLGPGSTALDSPLCQTESTMPPATMAPHLGRRPQDLSGRPLPITECSLDSAQAKSILTAYALQEVRAWQGS